MTIIQCGDLIRVGQSSPGSAGCLVQFTDMPDRLLLLVAGHVVLSSTAQRGTPVTCARDPCTPIGSLLTWTQIDGHPTVDAALIWLIPDAVGLAISGLAAPAGASAASSVGDVLRMKPSALTGNPRQTQVSTTDVSVDVRVTGPDWQDMVTYSGQYACSPDLSEDGDSGSMVLDAASNVVGMIVAGGDSVGTVITPIDALLSGTAWAGGVLRVLDVLPDLSTLVPPPEFAVAVQPPAGAAVPDALAVGDRIVAQPAPALALGWLTAPQTDMAQRIVNAFSAAGYGFAQQVAALANAWAESRLDPLARYQTATEDSVGLFQLNRKGGEGQGREIADLQDPDTQFQIVMKVLANHADFGTAPDADTAVSMFVRYFERPQDPEVQIATRQQYARKFQA